jgi:hypothetical protein
LTSLISASICEINNLFLFSSEREWEASIDRLDAAGLRCVARSLRRSCRELGMQVRWMEARLTVSERDVERLQRATGRPLGRADPVPPACDAACISRSIAAEARAEVAEEMLADMIVRHQALLATVRDGVSDRERRYLRRSGEAVYHV